MGCPGRQRHQRHRLSLVRSSVLASAAPAPILRLPWSFAGELRVVSDGDGHPREFSNCDDALPITKRVRLCGMGHVEIVELDRLKRGPAPVGAVGWAHAPVPLPV